MQLICELYSMNCTIADPPKGPPYTMTPTNDGRVRQRLLIRSYSYGHGYVNNQTVFGRDKLPKIRSFGGFIGPNTTPKILQNISKIW